MDKKIKIKIVDVVNEKLVLLRGRRPWLVNGRIDGSGRACQRPRTSSDAKCFSCEGALAREIAFLNFWQILAINVALGGASLAAEERGAAKPRGRGLGRATSNYIHSL